MQHSPYMSSPSPVQMPYVVTPTMTPSMMNTGYQTPMVSANAFVDVKSTVCACPFCHNTISTVTKHKAGLLTYLSSAFLCIVSLGVCFWIPFVVNRCQDVYHYCPNCQRFLGTAKRL